MNLLQTQVFEEDVAAAVIADPLDAATVGLIKNNITVDRDTPLATLTANEADYNTYAQGVITWDDLSISDDGFVEYVGTCPEFRPTDALAPNDIHALFVLNDGGTKVYFVAPFDPGPIGMNVITDAIRLTFRYRPATDSLVVVVS